MNWFTDWVYKASETVVETAAGTIKGVNNAISNLEYGTEDPDYEQSRYDFNSRVFPLDIGQAGYNGHYMVININVLNNSRFNGQVTSPTGPIKTYSKLSDTSKTDVLRFVIDGKWVDSNGETFKVQAALPRQTRRIAESIAIYMPNTVVYDTVNDYDQTALSSLASSGLSTGLSWASAMGKIGNQFAKIAGQAQGGAGTALQVAQMPINPRVEVLFRNTAQRQFLFEFLMAPRNQAETAAMQNIIRQLRFHAAPEYMAYTAGLLYTPPSEFDITFYDRGKENLNIPRINTCALEKVSVDYAPEGVYSTFRDGSPVACRLRLEFRELEVVTKLRVMQGF